MAWFDINYLILYQTFHEWNFINFFCSFINYIPIFLMIPNKCYIIIYKSDKNCIVVKLKNLLSIPIVFLKILNSLTFSKLIKLNII